MNQTLSKKRWWLLIPFSVIAAATALAEEANKDEQLFFSDIFLPSLSGGLLERLDLSDRKLNLLVSTGDGARGIAVDPANGKIYWSDIKRQVISKADLDGKNQQNIVTAGLDFPFDLDIDVGNKKIYWIDQAQNKISSANLDGKDQTFLIASPCLSPISNSCTAGGGLAIDSVKKKLYWTTAYCLNNACSAPESYLGDILRSDLDGSHIETVVTAIGRPSSIQIDPIEKNVYWTDSVNDVIRRSNLNGTGINDLFVVGKNNNPNSLALDLKNGYLYWSQDGDIPNRSCIKRMHLDGKQPEDVKCGFGNIADIEFVNIPIHH